MKPTHDLAARLSGYGRCDSTRPIFQNAFCGQLAPKLSRSATSAWRLSAAALALLLASCGGGGGDSGAAGSGGAGVAAGGAVAGGSGGASPGPGTVAPDGQAPLVSASTWVVMGSSTAAGVGATLASWPTSLQQNYRSKAVNLVNIARSGHLTYQGLPTASPRVANRPVPDPAANVDAAVGNRPKLLLLAYPSNDTIDGYSVQETVNNLMSMRSAANAQGAAVIIVSSQPRVLTAVQRAKLIEIDASISTLVGPCFVAVRESLEGSNGEIASQYDSGDRVHVNDAGHAVIFSSVARIIDGGRCVRV